MQAFSSNNKECVPVPVCTEEEPGLQTKNDSSHKRAHTHNAVEKGGGAVEVVRASSGLIKSSGDRGRVGCLPASLHAIFRSPAPPVAVQLSLQIQILAHNTDIYDCHSCLSKCEALDEQPTSKTAFAFFLLVHGQYCLWVIKIWNQFCFLICTLLSLTWITKWRGWYF